MCQIFLWKERYLVCRLLAKVILEAGVQRRSLHVGMSNPLFHQITGHLICLQNANATMPEGMCNPAGGSSSFLRSWFSLRRTLLLQSGVPLRVSNTQAPSSV